MNSYSFFNAMVKNLLNMLMKYSPDLYDSTSIKFNRMPKENSFGSNYLSGCATESPVAIQFYDL